jgi:uridylate kinase
MILGCKLSGELLAEGGAAGEVWTQAGLLRAVDIIKGIRDYVSQPNDHEADGALFVVGGGNGGFRGRELQEKHGMQQNVADRIGLMGTMINTVAVAGALEQAGVQHDFLIDDKLRLGLPDMSPELATPARVRQAFQDKRAALIGGGSGRFKQSTDSAVADHLRSQINAYGDEAVAFKATQFGGVYEEDPRIALAGDTEMPRRFDRISTGAMRRYGLFAIDLAGINTLEKERIPMILHGFDTTPIEALNGNGTYVIPDQEDIRDLARV